MTFVEVIEIAKSSATKRALYFRVILLVYRVGADTDGSGVMGRTVSCRVAQTARFRWFLHRRTVGVAWRDREGLSFRHDVSNRKTPFQ